jgi:FTR1 family protein
MMFMFGLSLGEDPRSIPLAVIAGVGTGSAIGYAIYKSGHGLSTRVFFTSTTLLLYFMAAGLAATGVGRFETWGWNQLIVAPEGGMNHTFLTYNKAMIYQSGASMSIKTYGCWIGEVQIHQGADGRS